VVVTVYPYPEDKKDVDQPALGVVGGDTLTWDQQFRVAKGADRKEPSEYEGVFTEMIDRRIEPGTQQAADPLVDALREARDEVRVQAEVAGLRFLAL
jgi:hypothetical protein